MHQGYRKIINIHEKKKGDSRTDVGRRGADSPSRSRETDSHPRLDSSDTSPPFRIYKTRSAPGAKSAGWRVVWHDVLDGRF